jgi:hypothetical protein
MKCDALDEPGDARANVDRFDRLEVSGELIEVRDIAGDRRRDGDRGCLHARRWLLTRRGECEKKAGALECVVPH